MPDDVLLNKCEIVERCLKRIQEDYEGHESELSDDFMRQDAILLNIQRMCEASIDLAMHVVRVRALGLPRESRGAFKLLKSAQLMDAELADKMMKWLVIVILPFTIIKLSTSKSCMPSSINT